ncbi:hypothetical protein PAPYR_2932 [Paratrimastix pyriformis]|uniref:Uncharacterized protein n=1 Tax=Paratrimastix pyriformis TaxID=342808 RepID=A0ABQ8UNF0_9EUKA|nr:hypothetical protein PAPYR_2932 [Paratrimastix pyriformis]
MMPESPSFGALNLRSKGITSFLGVEGMASRAKIEKLFLQNNFFLDFTYFGTLRHLTELRLSQNRISSFRNLLPQPSIQAVWMDGCPVAGEEHYRVMAAIAFGPRLRSIDGQAITKEERSEADKYRSILQVPLRSGYIFRAVIDPPVFHEPAPPRCGSPTRAAVPWHGVPVGFAIPPPEVLLVDAPTPSVPAHLHRPARAPPLPARSPRPPPAAPPPPPFDTSPRPRAVSRRRPSPPRSLGATATPVLPPTAGPIRAWDEALPAVEQQAALAATAPPAPRARLHASNPEEAAAAARPPQDQDPFTLAGRAFAYMPPVRLTGPLGEADLPQVMSAYIAQALQQQQHPGGQVHTQPSGYPTAAAAAPAREEPQQPVAMAERPPPTETEADADVASMTQNVDDDLSDTEPPPPSPRSAVAEPPMQPLPALAATARLAAAATASCPSEPRPPSAPAAAPPTPTPAPSALPPFPSPPPPSSQLPQVPPAGRQQQQQQQQQQADEVLPCTPFADAAAPTGAVHHPHPAAPEPVATQAPATSPRQPPEPRQEPPPVPLPQAPAQAELPLEPSGSPESPQGPRPTGGEPPGAPLSGPLDSPAPAEERAWRALLEALPQTEPTLPPVHGGSLNQLAPPPPPPPAAAAAPAPVCPVEEPPVVLAPEPALPPVHGGSAPGAHVAPEAPPHLPLQAAAGAPAQPAPALLLFPSPPRPAGAPFAAIPPPEAATAATPPPPETGPRAATPRAALHDGWAIAAPPRPWPRPGPTRPPAATRVPAAQQPHGPTTPRQTGRPPGAIHVHTPEQPPSLPPPPPPAPTASPAPGHEAPAAPRAEGPERGVDLTPGWGTPPSGADEAPTPAAATALEILNEGIFPFPPPGAPLLPGGNPAGGSAPGSAFPGFYPPGAPATPTQSAAITAAFAVKPPADEAPRTPRSPTAAGPQGQQQQPRARSASRSPPHTPTGGSATSRRPSNSPSPSASQSPRGGGHSRSRSPPASPSSGAHPRPSTTPRSPRSVAPEVPSPQHPRAAPATPRSAAAAPATPRSAGPVTPRSAAPATPRSPVAHAPLAVLLSPRPLSPPMVATPLPEPGAAAPGLLAGTPPGSSSSTAPRAAPEPSSPLLRAHRPTPLVDAAIASPPVASGVALAATAPPPPPPPPPPPRSPPLLGATAPVPLGRAAGGRPVLSPPRSALILTAGEPDSERIPRMGPAPAPPPAAVPAALSRSGLPVIPTLLLPEGPRWRGTGPSPGGTDGPSPSSGLRSLRSLLLSPPSGRLGARRLGRSPSPAKQRRSEEAAVAVAAAQPEADGRSPDPLDLTVRHIATPSSPPPLSSPAAKPGRPAAVLADLDLDLELPAKDSAPCPPPHAALMEALRSPLPLPARAERNYHPSQQRQHVLLHPSASPSSSSSGSPPKPRAPASGTPPKSAPRRSPFKPQPARSPASSPQSPAASPASPAASPASPPPANVLRPRTTPIRQLRRLVRTPGAPTPPLAAPRKPPTPERTPTAPTRPHLERRSPGGHTAATQRPTATATTRNVGLPASSGVPPAAATDEATPPVTAQEGQPPEQPPAATPPPSGGGAAAALRGASLVASLRVVRPKPAAAPTPPIPARRGRAAAPKKPKLPHTPLPAAAGSPDQPTQPQPQSPENPAAPAQACPAAPPRRAARRRAASSSSASQPSRGPTPTRRREVRPRAPVVVVVARQGGLVDPATGAPAWPELHQASSPQPPPALRSTPPRSPPALPGSGAPHQTRGGLAFQITMGRPASPPTAASPPPPPPNALATPAVAPPPVIYARRDASPLPPRAPSTPPRSTSPPTGRRSVSPRTSAAPAPAATAGRSSAFSLAAHIALQMTQMERRLASGRPASPPPPVAGGPQAAATPGAPASPPVPESPLAQLAARLGISEGRAASPPRGLDGSYFSGLGGLGEAAPEDAGAGTSANPHPGLFADVPVEFGQSSGAGLARAGPATVMLDERGLRLSPCAPIFPQGRTFPWTDLRTVDVSPQLGVFLVYPDAHHHRGVNNGREVGPVSCLTIVGWLSPMGWVGGGTGTLLLKPPVPTVLGAFVRQWLAAQRQQQQEP